MSTTPPTMRAAQLTAPGIETLRVLDLPVPEPAPGWVRLKVMAFGLNRSEYHSVTGLAEGMDLPRVLGIEAGARPGPHRHSKAGTRQKANGWSQPRAA